MKRLVLLCLIFNQIVFAQSPGGVPTSLTLWLKTNTSIPANLTYNGTNNVSNWKSDIGTYQVSQSVAAQQPVFFNTTVDTAEFNFNPFIQFNRDAMTTLYNISTTPNLLGTTGTTFFVTNRHASATNGSMLTYYSNSSYRLQMKPGFRIQNSSGSIGYKFDLNSLPGSIVNYPEKSAFILSSLSFGPASSGRRNATDYGPSTGNSTTYQPSITGGLRFSSNGLGGEFGNQAIAEVIFYNTTLTATDIAKVESYLAIKYGVTLDELVGLATNYIASDASIVWNKATNAGYNENITGIARDDASALAQKQSKSVNTKALVTVFNTNTNGTFPLMNDVNSTSFAADKSFFIFGDNDGDTTLNVCAQNGYVGRMNRIWKVQKTGTVNAITLALNTNLLPNVKNLLVSDNPAFPALSTTVYPLMVGTYKYAALTLNNNQYFTFASDSTVLPVLQNVQICSGNNGTVTISNPVPGAVYNWYEQSSGGAIIGTGTSFSINNLTNDSTVYVETVSQYNCILPVRIAVTIQAVTLTAPTATVSFQPDCNITTGTITVTAPLGADLGYSVDGINYQPGLTFSLLAPAIYNVTVHNTLGCVSPATQLTVNPVPSAPATATATVTVQPDCTISTGTITVTAPVGAGLEYSVDGINYQLGLVFTTLAPATYNVTVHNAQGCVSSALQLIVNPPLNASAAPTATVTVQPGCTLTTGIITVTAPLGAGLLYSINGTNYQPGLVFTLLIPGIYPVTVQNSLGCISAATPLTVNPAPPTPANPDATVTSQPNCSIATGTITVTAPIGAGLQYSIDGINYQSGLVFPLLVPGNYDVTVQNTFGCISQAIPLVVYPVSSVAAPVIAPVIICQGTSATINVTNSMANNTYSWYTQPTGGVPVFVGNPYTTAVLNTVETYYVEAVDISGCISGRTAVPIQFWPVLSQPVVTAVNVTGNSITFSWTAIQGAPGYLVSTDGVNYFVPSSGSSGTTHTLNGLTPDVPVTLYVIAVDASFSCRNSTAGSANAKPKLYTDIYVPSAFTPNADGTNDLLKALGNVTKFEINIYNRWSQLVYRSYSIVEGWDGNYLGTQQSTGTFVYLVNATLMDGKREPKGDVHFDSLSWYLTISGRFFLDSLLKMM